MRQDSKWVKCIFFNHVNLVGFMVTENHQAMQHLDSSSIEFVPREHTHDTYLSDGARILKEYLSVQRLFS